MAGGPGRINGDFTQRGHVQLLSLGEECGFIHHIDRAVAEWVLDLRESAGLPISTNVSVVTIEGLEIDSRHSSK